MTTKVLFTFEAELVGLSFISTWCHAASEARMVVVLDARSFPLEERSATVSFAVSLEVVGNRKKSEALYVQDESTLIPIDPVNEDSPRYPYSTAYPRIQSY